MATLDSQSEAEIGEEEAGYGVTPELVNTVRALLEAGTPEGLRAIVGELHAADAADLLEQLDADEREAFVAATRGEIEAETLTHLDEDVRDEVIEMLGPQEVAQAFAELETDDAVDILEDLDEAAKREILAAVPAAERAVLEQSLTYPEDSAGRLMQRDLVAVPAFWSVGETIDFLRASDDLPDDFYDLFVVDVRHKPVGKVPLSRAMRNKRAVKLTDIMESDLHVVPVDMDREQVAYMFRQYALVSAPVVDEAERLVGVITVDDVVHVIEEETEEDLMSLGGVGESDFHASAWETAWRRLRWLFVTLVNTIVAATVISQFDATIEQIVALAVLMPIVAAMGGNAGMQAVTVTVRALATRDLTPGSNIARAVGKELLVNAGNALVFAAVMGLVAGLWFENRDLGLVLAAAMIFNMAWAGLAGTVIPILLHRMELDPAVSAGPFLTTTTDVLGFFSFLGLATLFLL
jgi:magnesium transporter